MERRPLRPARLAAPDSWWDRLCGINALYLAPLPVVLVAIEKVLLAALRGLLAGVVIFPLAFWILGSGYQVRTDLLGILIGLLVLVSLWARRLASCWTS